MNSISVSQLKTNPSKAINKAVDSPIAIQKRNQIEAYLIGKNLYNSLVSYIEDFIDKAAVETTNFSKGKDFEKIAKDLGI